MADYDWFDRSKSEYEIEAEKYRPLGLVAEFSYNSIHRIDGIMYYTCQRGCGTLVWNPEDHMKNVCTTFNPMIGDDS